MPASFRDLGTQIVLGIPLLTILAVFVLVVTAWYLRNLRSGRCGVHRKTAGFRSLER